MNTTAPGASTASFAAQQTFVTGSRATLRARGGHQRRRQAGPCRGQLHHRHRVGVPEHNHAGVHNRRLRRSSDRGHGQQSYSVAVGGHQRRWPAGPPRVKHRQLDDNGPAEYDCAGGSTPSFVTEQTLATGGEPWFMILGDLNGDGKTDLAFSNTTSNTLSVLLNTMPTRSSTPSFASQQTFATGTNPDSVAVRDVNGDGLPDLIMPTRAATRSRCSLTPRQPAPARPPLPPSKPSPPAPARSPWRWATSMATASPISSSPTAAAIRSRCS